MEIRVIRFGHGRNSTISRIEEWGPVSGMSRHMCWGLEDEYREVKVVKETRIPASRYEIQLRTHGEQHEHYKQLFPDFHVGMLEVMDVPGFVAILVHIGNYEKDTAGCLLVGSIPAMYESGEFYLGKSREAYISFYKEVVRRLKSGERVFIEFIDSDGSFN